MLKGSEPLTRTEFLRIIEEELKGEILRDPCTNDIVGTRLENNVTLKTDTTSMIWEFSFPPVTNTKSLINQIYKVRELISELGLQLYPSGYYPNPGIKWYIRNASPRGHYRLLHWYGYSHWKIASMASTQIWLEVPVNALPRTLSLINAISPSILEKFANSECCSWKEYRVELWRQFAITSWATVPETWLPKVFRSWKDILDYLFSGRLQETSMCKDLSGYSLNELASMLMESSGQVLARSFDMSLSTASSREIIEGMQRWIFNPAIPRWWSSRNIPNEWLTEYLRGNTEPFVESLERTFIEVRFLPTLATTPEKLHDVIETLVQVLDAGRDVEVDLNIEPIIKHEYLEAAKGIKPKSSNRILEKLTKR